MAGGTLPERIIAMITGELPEPTLVIPFETWQTFELTGEEGGIHCHGNCGSME